LRLLVERKRSGVYTRKADCVKGVYVLVVRVSSPTEIKIGSLGKLGFKPGLYAYVGSAQNNLDLRVARHKRKDKPVHWHIDYLLKNPAATVSDVFIKPSDKSEECRIADLLAHNCIESLGGFGCSDCNCPSHMFRIRDTSFLKPYMHHM